MGSPAAARASARTDPADAWQRELAQAVTALDDLLGATGLDRDDLARAGLALPVRDHPFPLRVPRPFIARMRRGDPTDPLLRQVLPLAAEGAAVGGYTHDPVGDLGARSDGGLLRKYAHRALLIVAGGCAVNCRYCFRRHFPYDEAVGRTRLKSALAAVRSDASIHEVILSGGEPLLLDDQRLGELVGAIAAIPHVTRLRVHSRLPVVIPGRLTAGLHRALTASRLRPCLVLHVNHPNEVDRTLTSALARSAAGGLTLLNQSVLLAGVNDSADTLAALSEKLYAAAVLPYYLHLLDPVAGAAHFAVDEGHARSLVTALRDRLPGYLVPRLAREVAGAAAKSVLA